jgi:hypothetical protein
VRLPEAPAPIEFAFTPIPDAEEPRAFTELPPDRADEAPEAPDFLSNVDSRAKDLEPAGESDLPRMDGSAPIPQVRMESGTTTQPPASSREEAPSLANPAEPSFSLADLPPLSAERIVTDPSTSRIDSQREGDLFQEFMRNPSGNAELPGDISLNTTAWDFAPWVLAFRRAVYSHWSAPVAFYMGLIHGTARFEIVVSPDGRLRDLRVVEQNVGHSSLTSAAKIALEKAAPYRPLPSDFPEENLVLQITFFYPNLKR